MLSYESPPRPSADQLLCLQLVTTCETVLVKNHSEILQEDFQRLLDQEREGGEPKRPALLTSTLTYPWRNTDLSRMYNLLHRIPDGLDPLRARFETHIKSAGMGAVERIVGDKPDSLVSYGPLGRRSQLTPTSTQEPKAYVDALLSVHSKGAELVKKSFRSESGFNASLDKACREFVNRNKATEGPGGQVLSQKSPELLAKYADGLLKKTSKVGEEADLELALNQTVGTLVEIASLAARLSTLSTDDGLQVHRRQGCLPEVLLQDAGTTTDPLPIRIRRRRGEHDHPSKGRLRL